jgi:hypothetical protein
MIVFHGTTSLFDHFDLTYLGEGEGKSKFGIGHYASSVYDTTLRFGCHITQMVVRLFSGTAIEC